MVHEAKSEMIFCNLRLPLQALVKTLCLLNLFAAQQVQQRNTTSNPTATIASTALSTMMTTAINNTRSFSAHIKTMNAK